LIRTALARSSVETTDEVTLTLIGRVVNIGGEPIPQAAVRVLLVVLGRPTDETSRFKLEALRAFAAEIEEETGISAVIPET
jgi:hypothetical protein